MRRDTAPHAKRQLQCDMSDEDMTSRIRFCDTSLIAALADAPQQRPQAETKDPSRLKATSLVILGHCLTLSWFHLTLPIHLSRDALGVPATVCRHRSLSCKALSTARCGLSCVIMRRCVALKASQSITNHTKAKAEPPSRRAEHFAKALQGTLTL